MNAYISTGDAAQHAGVTAATVQKWADAGLVDATVTAGGTRRITPAGIDAITQAKRRLSEHGITGQQSFAIGAALRFDKQPEFPELDFGSFVRGYLTASAGGVK